MHNIAEQHFTIDLISDALILTHWADVMNNWSIWFPTSNSWLSAAFLTLLTSGLAASAAFAWQIALFLARISPQFGLIFGMIAVLSPIILVAIMHHLLHLILDRFFPETQLPGMTGNTGVLPGLMSWWEGLYSWLVIVLATVLSTAIIGSFPLSLSFLDNLVNLWDRARPFFRLSTLVWVLIAAYLYHFEHLVQQRLMSMAHDEGEDDG